MGSEQGCGLYQATYPGFQNGAEREPLEQYFETESYVGESSVGGSDIPAAEIGFGSLVDPRVRDRSGPPLLYEILKYIRVAVAGQSKVEKEIDQQIDERNVRRPASNQVEDITNEVKGSVVVAIQGCGT
jgi:hypothetical protein